MCASVMWHIEALLSKWYFILSPHWFIVTVSNLLSIILKWEWMAEENENPVTVRTQ